jgi:L-asparaginase
VVEDLRPELRVAADQRELLIVERGVILNATYGYRGSEQDLRQTGIIPAGFLSPQAARMKLLACLASGLSIDEVRWAFRQDDG